MPDLLYLVGQPGSGKSTLAAHLTEGIEPTAVTAPFVHILRGDVVELGYRRPEGFSGTDALAMNVQPKVAAWLAETEHRFVLGEGDRLANDKFFKTAMGLGWDLHIAYLALPASVADERRIARAAALGVVPQDPKWIKGRQTKARRLAEVWGSHMYRLDATRSPAEMRDELRRREDPVVLALDRARR